MLILISFKNDYKIYKTKKSINDIIKILTPFQKKIIDEYTINVSSKYEKEKLEDTFLLVKLLSYVNYSEVCNTTQKNELRIELINQLQTGYTRKNISDIEFIYLNNSYKFGNSMILLNNIIYYTEILNVSNIYLNSNMNWPLKNDVKIGNINLKIISPSNLNFGEQNIICFSSSALYFQKVIRPEIRINKIKNEIRKNLPKIVINSDDLYIHIRGGDIFTCKICKDKNYSQPPLCFYQKILNNFKFKNIY